MSSPLPSRSTLVNQLLLTPTLSSAASDPNRLFLASMIVGKQLGEGSLPDDLGLGYPKYHELLSEYFPDIEHRYSIVLERKVPDEFDDLVDFLSLFKAGHHKTESCIAEIIAMACAGSNHLWQDLGLGNREELSKLLWVNFPSLAKSNTKDMKWKKFLYRQLCQCEGIYICRSPSCETCRDFNLCFGPEN